MFFPLILFQLIPSPFWLYYGLMFLGIVLHFFMNASYDPGDFGRPDEIVTFGHKCSRIVVVLLGVGGMLLYVVTFVLAIVKGFSDLRGS